MKTIGVLGGMSWESSLDWYRMANERVRERLGGYHSASVLLDSLDFAVIEQYQRDDNWKAAGRMLANHASRLQAAGAEVIVLCTNTMHIVAPQIEAAITVPFLHIADIAGSAITAAGVRTVGLLGTAFTMEQPFYRERLATHGLETLTPDATGRQLVHAVIYDELVHGVVRSESRERLASVIRDLAAKGAEGVILGCTELELLLGPRDSPVPLFPTTSLHVDAALEAAGLPRA